MAGRASSNGSDFPVRVDRNAYRRPEYRFLDVTTGATYEDSLAQRVEQRVGMD